MSGVGLREQIAVAIHDTSESCAWAEQEEYLRTEFLMVADAVLSVLGDARVESWWPAPGLLEQRTVFEGPWVPVFPREGRTNERVGE